MTEEKNGLKRTRIVATIGPASSSSSVLRNLVAAGMDVARLNFSHSDYDAFLDTLAKLRAAAKDEKKHVAVLVDLQGPKIRVGKLPGEGMDLIDDKIVTMQAGVMSANEGVIPVPYERMAHDVRRGDRILIDDGTKELEVLGVEGQLIKVKVLSGGRLKSFKGINVPTVTLSVEALTPKDEEDLRFALQHDVDFVALSFVRRVEDVRSLKRAIDRYLPKNMVPPGIIAKIEKHEALHHFDEILEEVDGIMVARGDLGLETPATRVPLRQKELIAKCVVAAKPVITATHMLDSMQYNLRPTRAEVSDVANAVIDHTDAVMLSGETAVGMYPVKTVETMAEIIRDTEEGPLDDLMPHREAVGEPVPTAVAAVAVELARHINAAAILVTTHSGYSARAVSRFRPERLVFAATDEPRTRQQLLLSWGIRPLDVGYYRQSQEMVERALKMIEKEGHVKPGDSVVVVSGLKRKTGGYDSAVRVVQV
jgi:pyruvate kinase